MSYPGSKAQAGVWQRIIGQMPPHSVYVEAFFGSGQVFWRKRRAANSILIDTNPRCLSKVKRESAGVAICGDSVRWLEQNSGWLPNDAVVYCDPPYLLSTRQGRFHYSSEFSDDDHAALLAVSLQLKCRVLISGYPSDFYSSRLHGWRLIEYPTMTRGGKRTEALWCNFDEPALLHDWRFAGMNKRQRFVMKRFVHRWLARIDAMPARRRGYILHELAEAIASRQCPGPLDPATPPLVTCPDIATPPLVTGAVATVAANGDRATVDHNLQLPAPDAFWRQNKAHNGRLARGSEPAA